MHNGKIPRKMAFHYFSRKLIILQTLCNIQQVEGNAFSVSKGKKEKKKTLRITLKSSCKYKMSTQHYEAGNPPKSTSGDTYLKTAFYLLFFAVIFLKKTAGLFFFFLRLIFSMGIYSRNRL